MADLLPMFTCKICKVRLLERDCAGHLQRHGVKVEDSKVMERFTRGAPEVDARPGAGLKSFQPGKKRKGAKTEAELGELAEEELN